MILSIIITTLNEYDNLKKLLPYLYKYIDNAANEIIVVDSHDSFDQTEQLCLQYDVTYIQCTHSQRSKQLNRGATEARGSVYFFLHADVFPPTDFYLRIKQSIDAENVAGFFSYKFDSMNPFLWINSFFTKYDLGVAGGGDQCHFIEKSTFINLNGYDTEYSIMEDFEMVKRWRVQKKQFQIIRSNALVSARKYRKNSYLRVNLVNLIAFKKFKNEINPDDIKAFCQKYLKD